MLVPTLTKGKDNGQMDLRLFSGTNLRTKLDTIFLHKELYKISFRDKIYINFYSGGLIKKQPEY